MEAKAQQKMIRVSSKKANLVLQLIRRTKVEEAFSILENTPNKSAKYVFKLLNQAVANATENHGMVNENLFVSKAVANEGPTIKRYRVRGKGKIDKVLKRTSNIVIYVSDEVDVYNSFKKRK